MTEPTGTPRARALAGALRQAREASRVSAREVARRLSTSHSVVSYWENGHRVPTVDDVVRYLDAIGLDDARQRETILDLGRHVEDQDWLASGIPGISQQLAGTMECERSASTITEWSQNLIPGLLQTSEYARALLSAGDAPAKDIEAKVLVRMGRRDVVLRSHPVRLTAFIGAAALREVFGGPAVQAAQLRYVLKMAELETVTIRVIRQEIGWHPGLSGPFVLYDFDSAPSIVLLEHHQTGAFVYDPGDVAVYVSAAEQIDRAAMSPDDSARLIGDVAQEMEQAT